MALINKQAYLSKDSVMPSIQIGNQLSSNKFSMILPLLKFDKPGVTKNHKKIGTLKIWEFMCIKQHKIVSESNMFKDKRNSA